MKQDISRLKSNRSIFFSVGLSIALGISLVAMNYTTYENDKVLIASTSMVHEDIVFVEIPRTMEKKTLPPPTFEQIDTEDFVEDVPDFTEEVPEPIVAPSPSTPSLPTKPRIGTPIKPIPKPPKPTPPPLPKEPEVDDAIILFSEHMPSFGECGELETGSERKECSDKALYQWIAKNMKYPNIARANNIEGTVVAQFVIEKDGSISGIKIRRDIGGGCAEEVTRILKTMPKWSPGRQNYRPVRVQFNMPFKFKLQN